jgi:hypothetical protein
MGIANFLISSKVGRGSMTMTVMYFFGTPLVSYFGLMPVVALCYILI